MPTGTAPAPAAVGMTVSATARRLGVTPSTLRSWERRYGLRPSFRTAGGHRRYSAQDLAALQRMRTLVQAGLATGDAARASARPAAGPRRAVGPSLVAAFAAAVEALDPFGALNRAERAVAQYGPGPAWTDVFVPVLHELGDRWQFSGQGVEREHVASAAIEQALTAYTRRRTPAHSSPLLLGVAAAGEGHVLPLHALAAAATAEGITSTVLTALPSLSLLEAVAGLRPAAVLIWSQAAATADTRLLRGLPDRVPAVYVGGPGWKRRRIPRQISILADLDAALAAMRIWSL